MEVRRPPCRARTPGPEARSRASAPAAGASAAAPTAGTDTMTVAGATAAGDRRRFLKAVGMAKEETRMRTTTIDIDQPRGGPLVRWGAIVTGAIWDLAIMAVLTSLWRSRSRPRST